MKYFYKIILLIIFITGKTYAQTDKAKVFDGCATQTLMNKNADLLNGQNILDKAAYRYFNGNSTSASRGINSIANIPVVVHIVHNGGPENISDAQVHAAIAHFNQNFQANNNYQIQFCLAQRDPGNNF
ncbi:MAG TPA: hypothetical protein VGF30_01200, partial [Bacteroidia bacterium]